MINREKLLSSIRTCAGHGFVHRGHYKVETGTGREDAVEISISWSFINTVSLKKLLFLYYTFMFPSKQVLLGNKHMQCKKNQNYMM